MAAVSPRAVIIDTDAGLDDAWAMFMMMAAHKNPVSDIRVVGITCVFGNSSIHNVTRNVTRILQTVGETEIPVYTGAKSALVVDFVLTDPPFHGSDGFGDADLPDLTAKVVDEDAVTAIIKYATKFAKGTVSILALGPLTNLATAIRAYPEICDKFKEIMILGGNIHSRGNITVCGEANFVKDPESARIVLENSKCPISIVPLETFLLPYTPRFRTLRETVISQMDTPQIQLLNKVEAKRMSLQPTIWAQADLVAAAVLIEPKVIKKTETSYCTVELRGEFTRGMMVVDRAGKLKKPPNVTIVTGIDLDLYEKIVIAGAGGPFYK